jgi:hypothetical protein
VFNWSWQLLCIKPEQKYEKNKGPHVPFPAKASAKNTAAYEVNDRIDADYLFTGVGKVLFAGANNCPVFGYTP